MERASACPLFEFTAVLLNLPLEFLLQALHPFWFRILPAFLLDDPQRGEKQQIAHQHEERQATEVGFLERAGGSISPDEEREQRIGEVDPARAIVEDVPQRIRDNGDVPVVGAVVEVDYPETPGAPADVVRTEIPADQAVVAIGGGEGFE